MTQNLSIAANLNPEQRKKLFLEMQSSDQTISAIANREGVSRKFLHQQRKKGYQALEKGATNLRRDTLSKKGRKLGGSLSSRQFAAN